VNDHASIALIAAFHAAHKPIGAVCHGPAVFAHVTSGGRHLVAGVSVTGFSNTEEVAVHLDTVVPFSLEDKLKEMGGVYSRGPDWGPYAVTDAHAKLVTGQNPASSEATAKALLALL
jgi:putative intracellular protease/amidase